MMMVAGLPDNLKTAWVEALRSGKYKQCQDKLHDGVGFCCLGVLADIVDPNGWEPVMGVNGETGETEVMMNHPWRDPTPGSQVLSVKKTGIYGGIQATLATMNDSGESFEKIANFIESSTEI